MKRETPDHPKTLDLMAALNLRRRELIGILELLFHFVGSKTPRGNVGKFPNRVIARAVDWDGDPDALVNALIECGWLDTVPGPNRFVMHDWIDHCPDAILKTLQRTGSTIFTASGEVAPRRRKSAESPDDGETMFAERQTTAATVRRSSDNGGPPDQTRPDQPRSRPDPDPARPAQASPAPDPSPGEPLPTAEPPVTARPAPATRRVRAAPWSWLAAWQPEPGDNVRSVLTRLGVQEPGISNLIRASAPLERILEVAKDIAADPEIYRPAGVLVDRLTREFDPEKVRAGPLASDVMSTVANIDAMRDKRASRSGSAKNA